ncbi:MAG: hypothetical protein GX929_00450 [Clostridiales bacterium]|nr:hypothetical protein [Clostridiales bacterium]
MKDLICLRCGTPLRCAGREKLQLGQTGWILGSLPKLLSGALEVDIYICPMCGKLEFYLPAEEFAEESIPQRKCPVCRRSHDFDAPLCPFCKHKYYAR